MGFSSNFVHILAKPPEDGEVNEMTLSFRDRIRNSSPGGLRPSTEALHNIEALAKLLRWKNIIF